MASISTRRGRRSDNNIWPAFVDAQAQLVMGIIFLLTVFTVAQMLTADQLSGRESAITRLNQQISELNELLALERRTSSDLRLSAAQLAAELQSSTAARDTLTTRVAELAARLEEETARAERLSAELVDANRLVTADRERIEMQLRELESIRRDIAALRQVRNELEAQVGQLTLTQKETEQRLGRTEQQLGESQQQLGETQQQLGAVRDRSKELEARLASEQERTLLAQKEIEQRDIRLSELQGQLTSEQKLGDEARDQVSLLNAQIAALRDQLSRLSRALEVSEEKSKEQEVQIADLGRRLNLALASKVEELARYRSEFFGRLREVLGDRQDIRVVGDRFVFQSEVLFDQASADLGEPARRQLLPLVEALKDIAEKIPTELNWVLRVDGHTDRRPISTPQFPSNWELSTARAISVVKFLIEQGIPADRLAATGFGEYQPLDNRDDEVAFRRNRRIELKLTER
jgi:chemotaxis protein MotB